jgi:hypothetical protein
VFTRERNGVGIGRAHDEQPVARHRVHELRERRLVVRQIVVDVGVIELHARHQRGPRAIVQELRPLVEVRGVVFVALDHHVLAFAEAIVAPVVHGHAADQE